MNYIGKFISNFKDAYNEINGATLTGAIDAVVVRQEDGSFISSPFHVRFGKIGVLRSKEKVVDIEINGEPVAIQMKLGETGEAFFVEELEEGTEVSSFLGTSPLPNYREEEEEDGRSQDSGVEAEEVLCKNLKGKQTRDTSSAEKALAGGGEATTAAASGSLEAKEEGSGLVSERNEEKASVSCGEGGSKASPSVDVPLRESWKEDLVRSKSLTSEPSSVARKNNLAVLDGQGSKTDVEDTIKMSRSNRRRRRRKLKPRSKVRECQSSDNSTTSETMDLSSLSVTGTAPPATHDPIFLMEDVENAQSCLSSSSVHITLTEKFSAKGKNWNRGMSVSLGPDFHPFSDTDISPPPSPSNSRSPTPVKSDTEYECEKQKSELSETSSLNRDAKWSWTWGELPTPPTAPPRPPAPSGQGLADTARTKEGESLSQAQSEQRSMLGNMFSFMRATKKARHNPGSEGIYLQDLNLDELEPEVAALYFPRNSILHDKQEYSGFRSVAKDEDAESGNGTSLPQSPHSVEGAIGGLKVPSLDSDFEDLARHGIFDYRGYHDLAFSLCGGLHEYSDESFPESLFLQSLVTYDDFCENPNVLDSPNLVVRLGGKYVNWGTAAAQVMSLVLFLRPLPSKVVENLEKDNMPKKEIRKRAESKGYSWFSWGRQNEPEGALPSSGDQSAKEETSQDAPDAGLPFDPAPPLPFPPLPLSEGGSLPPVTTETISAIEISSSTAAGNRVTHLETYVATVTSSESQVRQVLSDDVTPPAQQQQQQRAYWVRRRNESSESDDQNENGPRRRYRKTIRLSSDQIKKLNLRSGSNEVMFSVTTAYQGTTRCKCHIYLWNYDEKIVISDIDGTITKSDVLGHILPIIGKDWAQGGVAQLFTKIKNNGYNFLYLSARAIGQARVTRDYLRSIKQGDVSLPDGPLLLNPTSLIQAFHREVIERKPEEFKISCLRDIKALFPSTENPFYAGYGNRINDVWAYSAVGIPIQRIFTINHRGELKHELTQTFQTTYSNLTDIVNHMFPPAHEREIHDEYSYLQFWRPPLPDLSAEIELALK